MSKKENVQEPEYLASPLNNMMLNYSVYVMNKFERIAVTAIAFIAGGFASLIFYGNLFMVDGYPTVFTHISNCVFFIVLGVLAVKFIVPMYKKRCLEKRNIKLKNQFRDMLESLSTSLSTGSNVQKSFEAALVDLQMQYGDSEYIVCELQEIINGMNQNINIEVMLSDFGKRSGNEDIVSFADVFEVCYRKGGNLNSVLQRTHSVMSSKMAVADEIETKLTSNKMQHNIMSIMPIVVVAMLRFTNESFNANFATPTGVLVNTIAIGIFVGSYIYGNKIVDVKE